MENEKVCAILNELLAGEQQATASRILESTVYVSQLAVAELPVAQRIARQTHSNSEELAELILDLGGVPEPSVPDVATAHLHFQDLHRLLPLLIDDHERLIRKYEIAPDRVASEPRIQELVTRILQRHQEELRELRQLLGLTPEVQS